MDHLTELLLAAQRGDRRALDRFVAHTHDDVLALCRYLGDTDNADDLAQETYERMIESLEGYRATGPARHWLLTIARRTCADATRRRARRRRLRALVHAQPIDTVDHHQASTVVELDDALLTLDPDRRAAFVLTQITGLRYEEAAEMLGVPIGTVRSRVARAREQLVALLAGPDAAAPTRELPRAAERPAP